MMVTIKEVGVSDGTVARVLNNSSSLGRIIERLINMKKVILDVDRNVPLHMVTKNTERVLSLIGREDIKVYSNDALAIIYGIDSKRLNLLGITTVSG